MSCEGNRYIPRCAVIVALTAYVQIAVFNCVLVFRIMNDTDDFIGVVGLKDLTAKRS